MGPVGWAPKHSHATIVLSSSEGAKDMAIMLVVERGECFVSVCRKFAVCAERAQLQWYEHWSCEECAILLPTCSRPSQLPQ